jgi:hypothetical protein
MAIEAPTSKFRKTNFKICIGICIATAIIFAYDGYVSKYQWSLRHSFYKEHVKDGKPDIDMVINQKAPFVFIALAAVITAWFWTRRNKKIIADENELLISCKKRIPYDSIQQIDKTYFEKKGFFVITYKDKRQSEATLRLSNRKYDNLPAVLEHLVAKIS